MAPIVELASQPGWRMLLVAHYCANTSAELGDGVFPKKPTNFLLFGVSPEFRLNVCNNNCPHRIDDSSLWHKKVMCYNTGMHPNQVVERDSTIKSTIPLKIFDSFWRDHQQYLLSL